MNDTEKLAALDVALAQGLSDIEAGRITEAETVFDALEAKYLRMAQDRMKSQTT